MGCVMMVWISTRYKQDNSGNLELALLIARKAWGILVIDFELLIPMQASLLTGLYFGPWIYMLI